MNKDSTKDLTRSRWLVLAVSCIINLCIGSMYAWSALSAPMAVELGVSAQDLTIAFSVCNSIGFIGMILGGLIYQKRGPKLMMFIGGLLFGLGMFLSGFANSVTHLVLSYGLCLGFGLSLVYGCTISNTIKFFPDKRGMVGGLTTAFYGISSVIFAPIGTSLAEMYGARNAFKILGLIFLIVICLGSLIMKTCPADFIPEGYKPNVNVKASDNDATPIEMLKSPVFYVMLIMLIAGGIFGLMIISNVKGIALNMIGVSESLAVLFVSILCLFNTAGRLLAGIISDKIGRINTLSGALVVALIGLGSLMLASQNKSLILFVIGIILVGICFGTFMGVFPGFTTDRFGTKYNVINYGIMWIGFCVAGLFGPMLLTKVYAATNSYMNAFIVAFLIAVLGFVMTFVYRKIVKTSK